MSTTPLDRLREILLRLLSFLGLSSRFARHRAEEELAEEMEFHLEMEIERNRERGLSPQEARRQARIRLGGVEQVKEAYRDQRTLPRLEQWLLDIRHGARSLWRSPAYTVTAVVVLALGIGANTAVFSVADAVLFRPLPFPEPDRLANFVLEYPEERRSYFDLESFRFLAENTPLPGPVASVGGTSGVNVRGDLAAFYAESARISSRYFEVLGVSPRLGRGFEEAEAGSNRVVLGHDAYVRLFGGSDQGLGSSVLLGGEAHIVVGVMPEGFLGVPAVDLWLQSKPDFQGTGSNFLLLTRLSGERSLESADAAIAALSDEYFLRYDQEPGERRLGLIGLREEMSSYLRSGVVLLVGSVALLLLIASANCASLMLARLSARRRELAIRSALGGGRRRLMQLLWIEGLLLALIGGVLAVGLARLALVVLSRLAPEDVLEWAIRLDGRVLLACLLFSLVSGALFSLGPVLFGQRLPLAAALQSGGRSSTGGGAMLWRRSLVVGQVAMSLALLVAAGLLVRTLLQLQSVDLGFDPARVSVAEMSFQGGELSEAAEVRRFAAEGIDRLRRIPGVEHAAIGSNVPGKRGLNLPVTIPEREAGRERDSINYGYASSEFFDALGVAILRGRSFDQREVLGSAPVAIVNEAFVREFFPSGEVLGRRIEPIAFSPEADDSPRTIIGVVADWKARRDERTPPGMFLPLAQATSGTMVIAHRFFPTNWILKVRPGSELPAAEIRRVMSEVAPDHPLSRIRSLDELVGSAVSPERFRASLFSAFSLLALSMAAAGLYGVISFNVSRRRREIGVRIALGATFPQIAGSVLREGLVLAGIGVVIGLGISLLLGRTLRAAIFEVSGPDLPTLLVATLLLLLVAAIASLRPAIRAARVDPTTSFRAD